MAPEPHLLQGELSCPRCGNDVLEAVSDGIQTNFLCHQCWTCWHWELGWIVPIPALTCPGCHHHEECLRRNAERQEARTDDE
jgi:hypothetical protein